MTYSYRSILFFIILITGIGFTSVATAQSKTLYNWNLGFGIGYTNYNGDLSNYRINGGGDLYKIYKFAEYNRYYQHQPSFSVLLQKKITPTLGIMFQANHLQFGMSDRYRKSNGSLDTGAVNFARSLNFRTTMQDAGLAFTFSPNNRKIGSETAFFYPSFYLGLGVSTFVVKGDLYDANNAPYNYRLPGNINDNNYETNLRDLRTETDSRVRNVEPYVDLGLALNFRISSLLSIAIQSDIKYSASDYLDDVSATYKPVYPTAAEAYAAKPGYNTVDPVTLKRGGNNGVNDFYINNRVVLNIALSRKKPVLPFNPPVIYSLGTPYYFQKKDSVKRVVLNEDSLLRVKSDSVTRVFKDSLLMARSANVPSPGDSMISRQLNNIGKELTDIKGLLRDQQFKPRLQQLQYQTDSIKNLKARVLSQRPASKENNLMIRIYDLQIDSLRNEYQKIDQRQNTIPGKADSSGFIYREAAPLKAYNTVTKVNAVADNEYRYDSIRLQNSYLKKVDSIRQRINELEKRSSGANQNPVAIENATGKNAVDSLNALKNRIELQDQLRKEEESLYELQQQLKSSRDSAAYFKRLRVESKPNLKYDTVQEKTSWFKRYFGIAGRKKNPVVKIDTIEDVGVASQERYYESKAAVADQRIDQIEKDRIGLASQRMNDVRQNNGKIDSTEFTRSINILQRSIQKNTDSITLLRTQLQRSNDSGAYYKRLMTEASTTDNATKRRWYQEMFTSEKKKQGRIEAENTTRERNIEQQRYFDNDANSMQNRINDLEKRNSDLQNAVQSYNSDRYVRRDNNFPVSPVIVYDGNNNSRRSDEGEIADLRAQLQNLQNEINYDARGRSLADTSIAANTQQPILQTPAPAATADTSQVSLLRSELNQLRIQLDSIKNKPAPVVAEKTVAPEEKFDVTSFPVVSVYFKIGSVVLTSDQLNKITPFVSAATKNGEAAIILKGFTDPTGNPAKNRIIANKRSSYIKNILVSKYKIKDTRISIEVPEDDVLNTNTRKANPLDRRVDLQFQ